MLLSVENATTRKRVGDFAAIDLEDNSLQQDTVTLQNLIQKRDSTYQTLISLVKKSLNAGATAIKGLGK